MKILRERRSFVVYGLVSAFNNEVVRFTKQKIPNVTKPMEMKYRKYNCKSSISRLSFATEIISNLLEDLRDADLNYERFIENLNLSKFPMSTDLLARIILSLKKEKLPICYETIVLRMCGQNHESIINNAKWLYGINLMGHKCRTGIPVNIDPDSPLMIETIRFIVFDFENDRINKIIPNIDAYSIMANSNVSIKYAGPQSIPLVSYFGPFTDDISSVK